jgi:hypothetical protein
VDQQDLQGHPAAAEALRAGQLHARVRLRAQHR